jgi:transcriptional regulator with GAF, ATPase, and Fis domain
LLNPRHDRTTVEQGVSTDDTTVAQMCQPRRQILAEAGRVFGAAFDPVTAPWNIAQFLVPLLADWSLIGVLAADGSIRRLAHAHVESSAIAQLTQLAVFTPSRTDAVGRVLRSGRPCVAHHVDQRVALLPPELRGLKTRSLLVVPMGPRRRASGVIILGDADAAHFGAEEARLASALALRAAVVLEISRRCDVLRTRENKPLVPSPSRRRRELTDRAQRRAELAREWIAQA